MFYPTAKPTDSPTDTEYYCSYVVRQDDDVYVKDGAGGGGGGVRTYLLSIVIVISIPTRQAAFRWRACALCSVYALHWTEYIAIYQHSETYCVTILVDAWVISQISYHINQTLSGGYPSSIVSPWKY